MRRQPFIVWMLFVFAGILLLLQWFRKTTRYEGFDQMQQFTHQRGNQVYDSFYADIYDQLQYSVERSQEEAKLIVQSTFADKESDLFLDVGCGTGKLVQSLTDLGYRAVGLDRSKAMLDKCACSSKTCGDALDPMVFERSQFSHITCMYQTVHEIADRPTFFRNCHTWLKPGGYFVVHIVDATAFDPIVPLGRPPALKDMDIKTNSGAPVYDTSIDFSDFQYKSSYDTKQWKKKGVLTHEETFTDAATHKIRKNERELFVPFDGQTIQQEIEYAGFAPVGQFTYPLRKGEQVYVYTAV